MTSQGGPHTRFKRALATGNLLLIRAAAAELPAPPTLPDALQICVLLKDGEPAAYDRAVVRWLGKFCLERPNVTLEQLLDAAGAFSRLPTQPDGSVRLLRKLVDRSA
jgi:hypothetical protein